MDVANAKIKIEKHLNQKSAIDVHGNSNEPPLVGNPFYCESMCGKNREVNWDRSHTAVQLEDCEDFFFSLFSYDSV